jgi:hypothetical protein
MHPPPDPEMRNRPAGDWTAILEDSKPHLRISAASDYQVEKLRRRYSFCEATASVIASLAFAGCPR